MAQTRDGAAKIAAKKAGLEVGEYLARRAAGLRRCTGCKEWLPLSNFGLDKSRGDGISAKGACCRRVKDRVSTKGRPSAFKGKTHSQEARSAMSAIRIGKPGPWSGKNLPLETRAKISVSVRKVALRGPEAPGYIDGNGAARSAMRRSDEAKRWRYDVMMRDGWACESCGDGRGGNLEAHHRKAWATHPELRFDIKNGVTLCRACHWMVHAFSGVLPFH